VSSFLGRVPVLQISVKNHFSGGVYPQVGSVQAVVDTGYDGFLVVPQRIYRELQLDSAPTSKRRVVTADGRRVEMESSLASVGVTGTGRSYDGPVETAPGVDEVLLGTRLLSGFHVTMNYCAGVFRIEPCPQTSGPGSSVYPRSHSFGGP
jgi:clan AA aspartic protease